MKKIIALLMTLFSFVGAQAASEPSYPGGEAALQAYIMDNLQYPASAKDNGIEGVVGVVFVVKADGTIGNIKIKRMVDPDLESEAIRLVKGMPKWTPADSGDAQAEVNIPFTLD